MTRKKVLIILLVVLVARRRRGGESVLQARTGLSVNAEAVRARDLEAIVSASGKIQPKRQVNISANQMGRVTRLAVEEGQRVKAGQFLLEIDPRSLEGSAAARRGQRRARPVGPLQRRAARSSRRERTLDLARQNLPAPAGAVEGRADDPRRSSNGRRAS